MAEYIKREKVYADISRLLIGKNPVDFTDYEEERDDAVSYILEIIKKYPAADVRPERHGKWKINCDGYYPYCSECGNEPKNGVMSDFCPNCGAKMDGKDV